MWNAAPPGMQVFTKTLSADAADQTIETLFESVGWNGTTAAILRLLVTNSMDLYATSTATAALSLGTIDATIIARSLLYIDVQDGSGIRGMGGVGGAGGGALGGTGQPGLTGGDALALGGFRTIINLFSTGLIFGGGGGGGGGAGGAADGGGGGGGGAGRNVGAGGNGGGLGATAGSAGTETAGGGGGQKGPQGFGGNGESGGAPGAAGNSGGTGQGSPGPGGSAALAIALGGGSVTWTGGTPPASQLKGAVS